MHLLRLAVVLGALYWPATSTAETSDLTRSGASTQHGSTSQVSPNPAPVKRACGKKLCRLIWKLTPGAPRASECALCDTSAPSKTINKEIAAAGGLATKLCLELEVSLVLQLPRVHMLIEKSSLWIKEHVKDLPTIFALNTVDPRMGANRKGLTSTGLFVLSL